MASKSSPLRSNKLLKELQIQGRISITARLHLNRNMEDRNLCYKKGRRQKNKWTQQFNNRPFPAYRIDLNNYGIGNSQTKRIKMRSTNHIRNYIVTDNNYEEMSL